MQAGGDRRGRRKRDRHRLDCRVWPAAEQVAGDRPVLVIRRWVADEGIAQAIQWCEEGRDKNAWVDLEIITDRVFTTEEQRTLRMLHPGIINSRPRLRQDAGETYSPEAREGKRMDELFRDYYRYRMGAEIPQELMEAFIEIMNENADGGDTDETEAS